MTNSPHTKKVLLLALSGIGNFLMQSPTFAAIKKTHPDWHVTAWVAPRGTKELAENDPNINTVIEASPKQSLGSHLTLLHRLRREKFDVAIMLSPGQLWKGAFYMWLAGIPVRMAHHYPFRSNPTSNFLLTHSLSEDPSLHDIEQNLALLKLLDSDDRSILNTPYLIHIPPAALRQADELWPQLNIPPNKTLIGLHPGSARAFEWKRWPLEYWIELGKTLINKYDAHILIFGGPDEQEIIDQLEAQLNTEAAGGATGVPHRAPAADRRSHRVGVQEQQALPPNLITTAVLMQRCKLFLSNDSGLMHLAAASGVTTLGLFGPTNEKQTGPRGKNSHALRAPNTQPIYITEKNSSLGSTPHSSLLALTPKDVMQYLNQANNSPLPNCYIQRFNATR